MLKIDVDQATRTVLLEPEGHLSKQDFVSLAHKLTRSLLNPGT